MAYTPLTPDQYTAARQKFTPDQIIQFEQQRKQEQGSAPAPTAKKSFFDKTMDVVSKASDVVGSIFPGQQFGKVFGTALGYGYTNAKDAITGSKDSQYYDLSTPSPLQLAGDVAKGAAMVGGAGLGAPGTVLEGAAQGAGLGFVAGAGQGAINTSGKTLPTTKDISSVAKGGITGGVVGGVVGGATTLVSKILSKTGDKILSTSIKPTKADIEDGFSIDTIKKHNLGGSLSTMYDKTESKMTDLTSQLNEKLQGSDATINLNDVLKDTVKDLTGNKLKSFGSNTSVSGAVEQLKSEIANVSDTGDLSIPEAQLVKQASGKFGAWQYGIPDPESTARQTVYNAFYRNLRVAIENGSPDGVKEINQQLSELIPVQNAIIRRIPVAERNSAISLGDFVSAAVFPNKLLGLGVSLAQKEGAVGNVLGKVSPYIKQAAPSLGGFVGSKAANIAKPPTN